MRCIVKGEVPEAFAQWKARNSAKSDWSSFSKPQSQSYVIYQKLRHSLISEQKHQCCYCEVVLKKEGDAHVEHLKDQGHHPDERFNFSNLLASCQYRDSCGHKKGNGFFKEMVSPLDENCQARFTYTARGKIIPIDEGDSFAQKTIDLLGLNCKRLIDRRLSIIRNLAPVEREYLLQALDNCVEWGWGFYTVIEYMIAKRKQSF